MKPRLLLYVLLALAGAGCLYSGLKFHRDIREEGTTDSGNTVATDTTHHESLTVGLSGSPLYTRTTSVHQAGGSDATTTQSQSLTSSWHPLSGSALLAVVGLVLLLAAGRVRKTAASAA